MSKGSSKRVNYSFGAIYSRRTKQGKDRWYLDYRDIKGKRIQRVIRHARSRQEAAIALQRAVQDVFNAQHNIRPASKPVSLPELVDQYLDRYAKTNKRSWKTDESYSKSMIEYFGNVQLAEISSFQVEGYKAAWLFSEKCSISPLNGATFRSIRSRSSSYSPRRTTERNAY